MTYHIAHGTLLSVMWQPGWEGRVWGRLDACTGMAESLRCSPETITMLLGNQAIPQYKIIFFEKEKEITLVHQAK